jgi:hypothetical protein
MSYDSELTALFGYQMLQVCCYKQNWDFPKGSLDLVIYSLTYSIFGQAIMP